MHWLANTVTTRRKPERPPTATEIATMLAQDKARPYHAVPCPRCLQPTLVAFRRSGITATMWTACTVPDCGYVRGRHF
ncbi:MAG: hypothetical protein M9930_07650 [Anaerolineae bacterium]|nr:hypothetical protein [Anaerolineae bacterium]